MHVPQPGSLTSGSITRNLQRVQVEVDLVRGRRCRLTDPVKGWGSTATDTGYVIIEPLDNARPRYEVLNADGVVIRSAADAASSDSVRLAQQGEVLQGTGEVESIGGVERIQLEDGWVSLNLPPTKNGSPGALLLRRL